MTDLGAFGGSSGGAAAVNDSGQVVGVNYLPGNTGTHAFSWTQAEAIQDLGTLGGTNSRAVAVNTKGWVIGDSSIAGDAATHAVLWSHSK